MQQAEHHSASRQAWLTALYIATALIALALHWTAHLHVVAALILGFAISAVVVGAVYVKTTRHPH